MQSSPAVQFLKTATRSMSGSASQTISSTSSAASRSAAQQSNGLRNKASLRMRIIVNGKGIVQTSKLSSFKPVSAIRSSQFHTSAYSQHAAPSYTPKDQDLKFKPFHAQVHSAQGFVAMAGSSASFDSHYSDASSYTPDASEPVAVPEQFKVGNVQTASNVVYSNKHSE